MIVHDASDVLLEVSHSHTHFNSPSLDTERQCMLAAMQAGGWLAEVRAGTQQAGAGWQADLRLNRSNTHRQER